MPKHDPAAQPSRLLRLPEVMARVGLTRSPIYRQIAAGTFPPAVSLGARAVAWRESDIAAWIEARPEAATGSPIKPSVHAERAQPSEAPAVPVAQSAAGRHARERRER